MVHKSKSENLLVNGSTGVKPINDSDKPKRQKSEDLKHHITKIDSVVRQLGNSILESHHNDRKLLLSIQRENVKNQNLSCQLEEARKENKQLLNVLQQQCSDQDVSRSTSRTQLDVSTSYSTISMVHLQYKYEELLASHEGLLKVLESKLKESQKCYKENDELRVEIQRYIQQISNNEKTIKSLCDKYLKLKQRKDAKITSLRFERDTLKLAHNQVVRLLEKKCHDEDDILSQQLQKSKEPIKALLLKEIQRTNKLHHENSRLQRENAFLKSRLNIVSHVKRDLDVRNSKQ